MSLGELTVGPHSVAMDLIFQMKNLSKSSKLMLAASALFFLAAMAERSPLYLAVGSMFVCVAFGLHGVSTSKRQQADEKA